MIIRHKTADKDCNQTHIQTIRDRVLSDDAILFLARQRPFEADVTGLNVRRMEFLNLARIRLAGGKTGAQRIRYSQIGGRCARTNHQREGIISVRLQVRNGY